MHTQVTSFSNMTEAERKLFIAELYHYMWYDEIFFHKIQSAKFSQENKSHNTPTFFPEQD